MAILKCKMCGGDLNIQDGMTVAECEYCGTRQTVPTADNEKKMTLFARANRLRSACEFDKAAGVYESIVAEFPEEAEAYWGLILCKYGIEYVDDPATGKKIPTCHRSSFDSIMDDSDFEQVMENADAIARRVYREEAKTIEELRKNIIEVSSKEEPYDIFICYKETDENGNRTVDSVIAQDIYKALTDEGYRVFFSRITLEDKLGQEYEPYIFSALNSAKVMLAVGTDYEYYNAVWVKNEWSRFLALIAKGEKKTLIPCYKDIDAYDMPKEFRRLQAQDMGKVGATQDLLRGIGKILPKENVKETVFANSGSSNADPLIKRVFMYLEDGEWDKANEYAERVLDKDPENAEAYLGKLMADLKVRRREDLKDQAQPFDYSKNFGKAIRFAEAALKNELTGYIDLINNRNAEEMRKKQEEQRKQNEALRKKQEEKERQERTEREKEYHLFMILIESEKRIKNLSPKINKLDVDLTTLRNQITKYNSDCEYKEKLTKEQNESAERIIELEKEQSGLGAFAFSKKRQINAELDKKKTRLAETQSKLDQISAGLRLADIDKMKSDLAKAEKNLEQAKSELEKAKVEAEDANNKLWNGEIPNIENTAYGKKQGNILYLDERFVKKGLLDSVKFTDINEYLGIVIPDSTVSINRNAFYFIQTIVWAIIPDSVTSIGNEAFFMCRNLTSITIGNSVTSIGNNAFGGCKNLTSITIPDSVTSIGDEAFRGCKNLTSITIPDSVTSIGNMAFLRCENLISITIPDSVTSIGDGAFRWCMNLTSITVDPGNKKYDSRNNCNAIIETETNTLLVGRVATEIPDSVTDIAEFSFSGNKSLTSITIPDSVTSIGDEAFSGCENLTSITVDPGNKKYDSRNNCNAIIETETNTLLVGCVATEIPDSVTDIAEKAFIWCKNLTSITVPDSVTSIGDEAFSGCENLTSITVDPGNKKYDSRNNCNAIIETETNTLLVGCVATEIPDSVTDIAEKAFIWCKNLTSITIPDSVTSIGNKAFFMCRNLTSITIPDSVTSIGDEAFFRCENLTSITIPDSVTSIGVRAFANCKKISEITRKRIKAINPLAL